MTPNSETDDAEIDIKSEEKDSPKGSERSTKSSSKSAAKRRTKTGCLTCRKRRIKCGEEKPSCKNCIKSKRDCAGYVQPLVYKQQQGLSAPDACSRSSMSDGDFQFNEGYSTGGYIPAPHFGPFNPFQSMQDQHGQPQTFPYSATGPHSSYAYASSPYPFESFRRHSFQDHNAHLLGFSAASQPYTTNPESNWPVQPIVSPASEYPAVPYETLGLPSTMMTSPSAYSESYAGVSSNHFPFDATPLHDHPPRRYSVHGFVQASAMGTNVPTLGAPEGRNGVGEDAEDPFDVEMDDDFDDSASEHSRPQEPADFSHGYLPQHSHAGHRVRLPYDSAVRLQGRPSTASPLLDERSEPVFTHFVNILAPCLSIFERPSLDPWASPARTLWSYTLPSAAMSNPALAHAILAIAGLHIAKLQQSSESRSLKHFTYAVRRVGRHLNLPHRRHDVTTFAAVLLLGFYEVLNSDHSRWNLHLAGATRLVTEHDLASLTYQARRTRRRANQLLTSHPNPALLNAASYADQGIAPSLLDNAQWDVDQRLISDLTGIPTNYDTFSGFASSETSHSQSMTESEVSTYKTKMDLWWWFCKQDMFQSMVSGEPLLMPYTQRTHCPPRGRIGIAEAHYATFDHLVLVLSRLADFGGKDRHRKQRSVESQGGQWRPPPWLFAHQPPSAASRTPSSAAKDTSGLRRPTQHPQSDSPPTSGDSDFQHQRTPSANEGRTRRSKPATPNVSHQEQPPMFGMMPPPPLPPKMNASFHAMDRSLRGTGTTPSTDQSGSRPTQASLEDETKSARAEHTAITKAFDLFHASLGPELQHVPLDCAQPSSPFGAHLRYASPELACTWALYYAGRILLHRLHPDMPPAAMIAAGVTAHLTKIHAQSIGQICAGLIASIPAGGVGEPLSPRYAGALMELTFPVLFAGIQYTDMSQRGWIISKLHDIAQMTGWSTTAAVAAACEISWERMGQAGKGPPYNRSLDRNNKDVRVNGHLRRLAPQLASALSDVESEHESQFVNHDRSLISKSGPSRVHWAMGLLSVEEDVKKMNIGQE